MALSRLSLAFSLLVLSFIAIASAGDYGDAASAKYGFDGIPADSPQAKPEEAQKPQYGAKPDSYQHKPVFKEKPGHADDSSKYDTYKPKLEGEKKSTYGTNQDTYKPKPGGEKKPTYGTNQDTYKPKPEGEEKPNYGTNQDTYKPKPEGEEKPTFGTNQDTYKLKPEGEEKPNYGTNQDTYKPKPEEKEKSGYNRNSYVVKPKPDNYKQAKPDQKPRYGKGDEKPSYGTKSEAMKNSYLYPDPCPPLLGLEPVKRAPYNVLYVDLAPRRRIARGRGRALPLNLTRVRKARPLRRALGEYRVLDPFIRNLKLVIPSRVLPYLVEAGFGHIGKYEGHCKIEPDLIAALVKRWRPETHAFHLPCGECTITLENVSMHLELPVDGYVISGMTHGSWTALCREYLGRVPKSFNGGQIPLNWLDANFQELSEDASDDEVKMYAWACILQLIGGLLMLDKLRNQVHCMWLRHLGYFYLVRSLSWGSAVLAFLMVIPPELRGSSYVWMAMVPLICYAIVEWHSTDRVLRQFGYFQPIPEAPHNMYELHSTDRRGKTDTNWLVRHHKWVVLWDDRHRRLPRREPFFTDLLMAADGYYEWFNNNGKLFLLSNDARGTFTVATVYSNLHTIAICDAAIVIPLPDAAAAVTWFYDPVAATVTEFYDPSWRILWVYVCRSNLGFIYPYFGGFNLITHGRSTDASCTVFTLRDVWEFSQFSQAGGIVRHTPPGSLFYGGASSSSAPHQPSVAAHDNDDNDGDDDDSEES
ncbi:putative Integrase-type DNA-binding superfamily protein [Hibiscus syriacus]|uniref:Integrase-type DNA-binding superfamily protein n=1 Tax=Hibiscus syriacus TaxID=106335 RepID=A0A6A2Y0P5_HIBSY|nr:putative Integrase-type DNA-binding superfamily protein [Hibiscus syriacus]